MTDPALLAPGIAGAVLAAMPAVLAIARGGYFISAWGLAAMLLAAALVMLSLTGLFPALRSIRGGAVFAGLMTVFALWSWASVSWAANADNAWQEAMRSGMYALAALVAVALIAHGRHVATAMVATILVGTSIVALATIAVPAELMVDGFADGRLMGPVGYHNGFAAFLVVPMWAGVSWAADRNTHRLARAGAAAAAMFCLVIAVYTQSRGAMLGVAVGSVVLLIVSPARVRVGVVLAGMAAGVVAIWQLAAPRLDELAADEQALSAAAELRWIALAAAATSACVVAAWAALDVRVDPDGSTARLFRLGAVALAVGVLVTALAVGGARYGNPSDEVQSTWDEFSGTAIVAGSDRLGSISNNGRIELWRVAWSDAVDEPLTGVGAANWEATYYQQRDANVGWVRQPHNLPLEMAAERGFTGLLMLLAALVAAIVGAVRARWHRSDSQPAPHVAAAMIAGCAYWVTHAQLGWLWQLPAVTLTIVVWMAMLASAPWARWPGPASRLARVAVAAVGVVFAVATALPYAADQYLATSRDQSIDAARQSLQRADNVYPLSADVAARLATVEVAADDAAAARAAVADMLDRDPDHWARYEYAADILDELGDTDGADGARARSVQLNPRER